MTSYVKLLESVNRLSEHHANPLHISVIRNITLEPVFETLLQYELLEQGFHAEIRFGQYDQMMQDVYGDGSTELFESVDIVLVFLNLATLSHTLSRQWLQLDSEMKRAELERIEERIEQLAKGIRGKTNATILWYSFELPSYPVEGIERYAEGDSQTDAIMRLNQYVRRTLPSIGNIYVIDLNLPLMRIGYERFYDLRYWHMAKAPYSKEGAREISAETARYITAIRGTNRKCIVLDCDQVLWGGIIGEDGLTKIKLGMDYPGSTYYEFQQELLNLHKRGVILALCSKNNEADVLEVLRRHPYMLIQEKHIAAYQINWDDKATNIRRIAEQLNIGLDSLVFIDDSEFEIEWVKQSIPEVKTIQLNLNQSYNYRHKLLQFVGLDKLATTYEDLHRTQMYQSDQERHLSFSQFQGGELDHYYKSLEMKVTVQLADDFAIPRIAQLTQKTNQFNLTTKRYTEHEINTLSRNKDFDVLYMSLSDKFGDLGIVGVAIVTYMGRTATIDTFLMSCRVIGRRVEDVLLSGVMKRARERKVEEVIGIYMRTSKNEQVHTFYASKDFKTLVKGNEYTTFSRGPIHSEEGLVDIFKSISFFSCER